MKPRLCVDIDNVIARTDEVMRAVIREVTRGRVNLRYSDITTFNYWECKDSDGQMLSKEEWDIVHHRFSDTDHLLSIPSFDGVQQLLGRLSHRFLIHFATSRLPKARRGTIEWLEENGFHFSYDLHFIQHGEKHTTLGQFTAAVEDDLDQARAFATSEHGTHSFLLAHPWNETATDTESRLYRCSDWDDLADRLLNLTEPS